MVVSSGDADTAATALTYARTTSGSTIKFSSAATSESVPSAASATSVIAARERTRLAAILASSSSPRTSRGTALSDAAAVTAAAARISASPTRAAASIAFVAASVSPPARVGWTRTVPSILILARARPDVSAYAKSLTSFVTPPRVTFAGRRTPRISVDDDAVDNATSTSSPRGPRDVPDGVPDGGRAAPSVDGDDEFRLERCRRRREHATRRGGTHDEIRSGARGSHRGDALSRGDEREDVGGVRE